MPNWKSFLRRIHLSIFRKHQAQPSADASVYRYLAQRWLWPLLLTQFYTHRLGSPESVHPGRKRETVKQNVLAVNLSTLLIRTLKLSAIASCRSLLDRGQPRVRSVKSPNTGRYASTPSWLHKVHQNLGSPPLEGCLAYRSLKALDSPDWYCCFK